MTFLNPVMLLGLVAVAVPILIHLLNRRRSEAVGWGAMRFLLASLVSRNRRILLEQVALMVIRCLLIALIVLAMARPFVPSRAAVPWVLVLAAMPAAVLLAAVAAAMWTNRTARTLLLAGAAVLLLAAAAAVAFERAIQSDAWSRDARQDVAIVLDGSLSMDVRAGDQTNFHRALAEARAAVNSCRAGDAVSVIVAGAVPHLLLPVPSSDRQQVLRALEEAAGIGGTMNLPAALNAAAATLTAGNNPAKRIVVLTDSQRFGWNVPTGGQTSEHWKFLAANLDAMVDRPQVICRMLSVAESFRNVAVEDISISRRLVGTDRDAGIDVKVVNTGSEAMKPSGVELAIDGQPADRQPLPALAPNAAQVAHFSRRFDRPGQHVLAARLVAEDDLPGDNSAARVLNVVDRLRVLIIDGAPGARPLDGAADFLAIALAPAGQADPAGNLVALDVVPAADIAKVSDLSGYSATVLANVPQLPARFAEQLARFVLDGGGLLICPGDRASAAFYELWKSPDGRRVAPARLIERRSVAGAPARLAVSTFQHPALRSLADLRSSDANSALVYSYWRLEADESSPLVRIAGRLDTGEPALVEHMLGRGPVLMTALSLDRHDSNLPTLQCYVPLAHELIYHLASPALVEFNHAPAAEAVIELPLTRDQRMQLGNLAEDGQKPPATAETPSGQSRRVRVTPTARGLRLSVPAADEPGLYRLRPGDQLKGVVDRFEQDGSIPLAITRQIEESRLAPLTEGDLQSVARNVDFLRVESVDELVAAVGGGVPGAELWQYLTVAALLALLAETAVTRWVAVQRGSHHAEKIEFGGDTPDPAAFRQRARRMLSRPPQEART